MSDQGSDRTTPAAAVTATPAPSAEDAAEAERVAAYLRAHPRFFVERPELLAAMEAPRRVHGERVSDFMSAMIERLRRELERTQAAGQEIVAISRANQANQGRVHSAVLSIMQATDRAALRDIVAMELPVLLGLDAVAICAEDGPGLAEPKRHGLHLLPAGAIERLIPPGRESTLRPELTDGPAIYGEAAALVKSDALVRLAPTAGPTPMMLACGSRTPGTFQPGQGTELLSFLAGAVALCLASLP